MFVEFFFVLFCFVFFLTENLEATVSVDKKLHIAYRLAELDFFCTFSLTANWNPGHLKP